MQHVAAHDSDVLKSHLQTLKVSYFSELNVHILKKPLNGLGVRSAQTGSAVWMLSRTGELGVVREQWKFAEWDVPECPRFPVLDLSLSFCVFSALSVCIQ